jgi:gluconolactonase
MNNSVSHILYMKKLSLLTLALLLNLIPAQGADFDIKNPGEFSKIVPSNAEVTKVAGGMKFLEGPIWVPRDGGYLLFSNIPDEELKKWSAVEGLTTFRTNGHSPNGNCLDRKGRLVTCEGGARRVTITEKDGTIRTLVDRFEGKKFNSPNDLVVKSDGTVWFTDPDYGLGKEPREVAGLYVYRLDPKTGSIAVAVKEGDHPNGICFSPDEKRLYVADSGRPHLIRVYDVQKNGTVDNGRVFCVIDKGGPDGIRCDAKGRIFSSAGDGVHVFGVDGALIGKILVPECPANLCFGGKDGKTLFITARTSLYSVPVLVKGAK